MKRLFGMLMALTAAATGCAGGAWLETPTSDSLVPPAHGYPTAIRPAAAPAAGKSPVAAASQPPQPAAIALDPNPAPVNPEGHPRVEEPHLPQPSLAVLPPHLQPAAAPPVQQTAYNPATEFPAPNASAMAPGQIPEPLATPSLPEVASGLAPIVAANAWRPPPSPNAPPASAAPAASHVPPLPSPTPEQRSADIDRSRTDLIAALHAQVQDRRKANAADPDLPRLEQELRLAYLLAGRLDDAVAAIEVLDQPQREAYKDLMFSLGVWLSPDEARSTSLRSAKVLRSLRDSTRELAAASKLELRKLAFCEKVEYFGWYTEFPRAEFTPKQEVILYVEVENYSAEHKSAAGYETELQGRYEILDAAGQIVAERELPLDKETCRNYRRDYFLAYRLHMPEAIAPGRYRLELTLEDRKASGKYQGRKFGQGTIEFTVR
jgi:hypothetical protein